MYSKKVMKHFLHPHNMGEIKNPDGRGEAGNIVCGDVMQMYIKIKKNKKERIKDIKFQTFGCAAAIAVSSVLTELVKGKTLDEAMKIKIKKIVGALGGLPQIKMHCAKLALDTLHSAIKNYKNKVKK